MSTIFTKIISGEIPCHKLAENDRYLSFLDIRPIGPGHALVIPKQEVDYIFEVEDELLGGLLPFAKPIARAIESVVSCQRIGIMVAGLEVPHAHVHLVPIRQISDLNFANCSPAEPEVLARLAEEIRAALGQ